MKKAINTNKAPLPVGPYNQAVMVKNTLYISGQVALNPANNELIQGSIDEESHQIMKNIESILKEAGSPDLSATKTGFIPEDDSVCIPSRSCFSDSVSTIA